MSSSPLPLVSVVMPAYNVEAYIEKAIQSILAQTYTHFELIIADDHSKDGTSALISSFSDSRILSIKNIRNLGYADNMNTLFKAAKGQYLVIQDADDYCTENRLQVLVDFLQANESIDMVGSSYIKVEDCGKEEKIKMPEDLSQIEDAFRHLADPLPVLNGSVMFRRKIIDQGFFFRKLGYVDRGQDDDWLFRVSERFSVANEPDYLYYYRFNPASMTMNPSYINYFSIFSGDYVRFLKQVRMAKGIDLLGQNNTAEIEDFFRKKKIEVTRLQPAYLELYMAHKCLASGKKRETLVWLLKALIKNPGDVFIWKKIVFILLFHQQS